MRALRQLKFLYMCHIAHFAEENSKFLFSTEISPIYSHLFNKRGGWNKRGGGAKVAKLLNVEVGINVEGGIFWKKLVHNSNKRGVEGGKI